MRVLIFAFVFSFGQYATAAALKSPEIQRAACVYLSEQFPEESLDRGFEHWGIEIDEPSCRKFKTEVSGVQEKKLGSKSFVVALNVTFEGKDFTCDVQASRGVQVVLDKNDKPKWIVSEWNIDGAEFGPDCRIKAHPFLKEFEFSKTSKNARRLSDSEVAKLNFKNTPESTDLAPDDGTYGAYSHYYAVFTDAGKLAGYVEYMQYYNSESESGSGFILKYNLDQVFVGYLFNDEDTHYLEFCEFLEGNLDDEDYRQSHEESCK